MSEAFAEIIGDGADRSPWPILLRHWLAQSRVAGDIRATSVDASALSVFLAERQADIQWRGCIATPPMRHRLFAMVSTTDPKAGALGAIDCVVPQAGALLGVNLALAGIEEALDSLDLEGGRATIIGTGSTAKAAIAYLDTRSLEDITVIARSGNGAALLCSLAPNTYLDVITPDRAEKPFATATLIVNTSPLGLAGATVMPPELIDAMARHAEGAVLFDTNFVATDTAMLSVARAHGARVIDGTTMVMGEARLCFELFFGCPAPPADLVARDLLRQNLTSAAL